MHPSIRASMSAHHFCVFEREGTGHGRSGKETAQLILPPPPRHCPVRMTTERPPSAALGRPAYVRVVRERDARYFRPGMGRMCAGSFSVVGPASSISIRKFLSAIERRLAMRHPAVPPATHKYFQSEEKGGKERMAHRPL